LFALDSHVRTVQDNQDRKIIAKQMLWDSLDRRAKTGHLGQDSRERTDKKGQSEHVSKKSTAGTEELESRVMGQDSWDRTPGEDIMAGYDRKETAGRPEYGRTGQLGQNNRDRTTMEAQPRQVNLDRLV
jgi:hypothetical protein